VWTGGEGNATTARTATRLLEDRVDRCLSLLPDAQYTGQHREGELAAGGLWPAREERPDPAERGVSLVLWHDQHPRACCDCRDEGVGGATLPMRELGLLRQAELGSLGDVGKV
jgi:hypothetical protein